MSAAGPVAAPGFGSQRQVQVLGDVSVAGRPVPGRRLRALLVALVLARGRTLSAAELLEAVWGADVPRDPGGALQALVARLRRTTGLPVEALGGGYRTPAGAVVVDALALPSELAAARRDLDAGRSGAAGARARRALAGWDADAGSHLAGVDASRARSLRRDLVLVRLLAARSSADAADRADALADVHDEAFAPPVDEPLAAAALDLLVADGRASQALARYDDVRRALAELGARPSAALRSAHARALAVTGKAPDPAVPDQPGAPAVPVTTGPTSTVRVNTVPESTLPGTAVAPPAVVGGLEPLLGREADLAALQARVDEHVLVTLVGPGGVGKTSLVAALADAWRDQGQDIHEIPLAGVRAGQNIAAVVTAALRGARAREVDPVLAGVAGRDAEAHEELRRVVAGARGLIVLDNCEHLLAAVADVALLMGRAAGPGLRVVATSRSPLGVMGERVHDVRPLADAPALALMRRRALALGVADAAEPSLREICARLDNLPLALELAAARLRTMTPRDLLRGLDDRFALLGAGATTLPERHRSLQALVDWSWELLDDTEQVLLRRLAVFPSGAQLAAVAEVCADGALVAAAIPAALAALVDASLVVLDVDGRGEGRYRLLETIRQYAEARTGEDEREQLAQSLAVWCARLATRLEPVLGGHGQVGALGVVAAERDALAASLRWAAQRGRADIALPVALVLTEAATLLGQHEQVVEWVRMATSVRGPLDMPDSTGAAAEVDPALFATAATLDVTAVIGLAMLADRREAARAQARLRRALRRRELLPAGLDALAEAVLDLVHGRDALRSGGLARLVEGPPSRWQAVALLARAGLQQNSGRGDLGLADALAAHEALRDQGNIAMQGTAAAFVAERLASTGDPAGSLRWWDAAERIAATVGADGDARQARLFSLRTRAQLAASDPEELAHVRRLAAELAAAHPEDELVRLFSVADIAADAGARGDWTGARELYAEALERARAGATPIPQVLAFLQAGAAVAEVRGGRPQQARPYLVGAEAAARSVGDVPAQAMVGEAVALWCAATGRPALAAELAALTQRFASEFTRVLDVRPSELDPAVLDPEGTRAATAAALPTEAAVAALHEAVGTALQEIC